MKGVEFDSFRGQETIGDSRVDFVLSSNDSNIRTLVEVKNVVCADYAPSEVADTLSPTKRKKMKLPARYVGIEDDANLGSYKRAAIFPHGSKHKDLKVVSPRAIKHICGLIRLSSKAAPVSDASSTELEASEKSRKRKKKLDSSSNKKLKVEPKLDDRYAAVLLFIVNRSDAEIFRPCHEADMLFAQLVKKAIDVGVKVIAQEVRWELTPSDEKNAYEVVAKLGRLLPVQVSATVDANSIDEDHLDQIIKSFSE